MKSLGTFATASAVLLSSSAFAATPDSVPVPVSPLPTGTIIDTLSTPFDLSGIAVVPGPGGSSTPYSFVGSFDQQVLRQTDGTLAFLYQFNIINRTIQTWVDAGTVNEVALIGSWYGTDLQFFDSPGPGLLYPTDVIYPDLYVPISAFSFEQSDIEQIPRDSADNTTRTFFVLTSAQNYDTNGHVGLDLMAGFSSGLNGSFPAFEPIAVPEPSTLALLPLGLAAVAFRRRGPF